MRLRERRQHLGAVFGALSCTCSHSLEHAVFRHIWALVGCVRLASLDLVLAHRSGVLTSLVGKI